MLWWLRAQLKHIASVLRWNRTDLEIDEELLYHLEMRIKEFVDQGMSPEDARRAAIKRFGNVFRVKETSREIRRGTTIDSIREDFRYSARMLMKQPSFILVVALTMMIGIGSNTAIFSVVNSVLLKPLPYDHPSQLAMIWADYHNMKLSRFPTSGTLMGELRDRSQLLQGVGGIWANAGTFTGVEQPEQVKLAWVTENFFSVLGVKPALGRAFLPGDGDNDPVMMLSDGLWHRRFGGDPKIIGKRVRFNDGDVTVVGVLPPDFLLAFPPGSNVPMDIEVWTPLPDAVYKRRGIEYLRMLCRLKPNVTIDQTQSEVDSITEQVRNNEIYYKEAGLGLEVIPLQKDVVREIQPALLALLVGAGVVLLISSFNVANLLLGRANARKKEMAVRTAMGASKWRIARQLFIESLAICAFGGLLGLFVGWIGLKLLMMIRPESLARVGSINLDWTILGYVTGITLVSGVLAGLAPTLDVRKLDLAETLKEEGRSSSGRSQSRMRSLLIVSEVALGFVILVGAGLMVRTLSQLHRISPGFNPDHTLTFQISFDSGSDNNEEKVAFIRRWEEKLATLPGVKSVGAVSHLPLDDYPNWYNWYQPEGTPENEAHDLIADNRSATPGYFQAIGARLISGRYFDSHDSIGSKDVAIIDETVANQAWPGQSAIGKKIYAQHYTDGKFVHKWTEVVGVVEHIKGHSLLKVVRGQIYMPFEQCARWHLSYVMRGDGDLRSLAPTIREELAKLNPNLAIAKVQSMNDYVAKAMAPTNFTVVLAGIFAGLALLLAAIGIYGVISCSLGQRTREIGIRLALGASPGDILKLVVKEGLTLTVFGLAIGLVASILLSGYLNSLLFGVIATDPVTYAAVLALIPLVAIIACWRPARKAAAGGTMDILRQSV